MGRDRREGSVRRLCFWMFGVVVSPGAADPRFTAFCLSFQDLTTANHIAQWAETFITIDRP